MNTSIIICSRNRKRKLKFLIKYIGSHFQDINELIIIDNSDTFIPSTYFKNTSYPFPIKVHRSKVHSIGYLRNLGLKHAKSKIIIFIDDDVIPNPKLIQNTIEFFRNKPHATAYSGNFIPIKTNIWSLTSAYFWIHNLNRYPSLTKVIYFPTACVALNRNFIIKNHIYFNRIFIKSGDDVDFFLKIHAVSGELWLDPKLTHQHAFPSTYQSFIKKHMNYGREFPSLYLSQPLTNQYVFSIWYFLPRKDTNYLLFHLDLLKKLISNTRFFIKQSKLPIKLIIPGILLQAALIRGAVSSKISQNYLNTGELHL